MSSCERVVLVTEYFDRVRNDLPMLRGEISPEFNDYIENLTLLDMIDLDEVDLPSGYVKEALNSPTGTQELFKRSLNLGKGGTYELFSCLGYYYYQCMWGVLAGTAENTIRRIKLFMCSLVRYNDDEAPINFGFVKDA